MGIVRGFLLANASAAVVSLWSVDDGSTAALMRIKYKHLFHKHQVWKLANKVAKLPETVGSALK